MNTFFYEVRKMYTWACQTVSVKRMIQAAIVMVHISIPKSDWVDFLRKTFWRVPLSHLIVTRRHLSLLLIHVIVARHCQAKDFVYTKVFLILLSRWEYLEYYSGQQIHFLFCLFSFIFRFLIKKNCFPWKAMVDEAAAYFHRQKSG